MSVSEIAITPRSRLVWVLTTLVLALGAAGLTETRLGLPQADMFRGTAEAMHSRSCSTRTSHPAPAPRPDSTDTPTGAAIAAAATTPAGHPRR